MVVHEAGNPGGRGGALQLAADDVLCFGVLCVLCFVFCVLSILGVPQCRGPESSLAPSHEVLRLQGHRRLPGVSTSMRLPTGFKGFDHDQAVLRSPNTRPRPSLALQLVQFLLGLLAMIKSRASTRSSCLFCFGAMNRDVPFLWIEMSHSCSSRPFGGRGRCWPRTVLAVRGIRNL